MRRRAMMIQTLREDPGDAEIDSHKLLVRAALVKKTAAGLFTFLPLGMRALRKVEAIVREEMDRAGAQELLMPILQPAELWQTTGRWETMGANMFKLKDRAQHDFALGPTAEEEVTDVVKSVVSSYRQLPVIVYQIQTKFRDETRPRFGLMRSKEFIMKDAYSFDVDAAGADESYWNMYHAYERIFARCGLKATPVQADGGDMGDSMTHEFHALADAGEDGIASCPACGYAANLERAERKLVGVSQFVDGLRVTDEPTMEIVRRTLNNVVNADLVKKLQAFQTNARPLHGNWMFTAEKITSPDRGYVGEPVAVDTRAVREMLDAGIVPVVTPLGTGRDGHLYNVNADSAAAALAKALKVRKFAVVSDVPGLLRDPSDPSTLLPTLHLSSVAKLKAEGVIAGGMLPKIEGCEDAIRAGVRKVHLVDGRMPHSLLLEIFTREGVGTEITE